MVAPSKLARYDSSSSGSKAAPPAADMVEGLSKLQLGSEIRELLTFRL